MSSALVDAVLRCSEWSRVQQLDPIGTAGTYRGFLLIEIPLPWPRDIAETAEVVSISDLLADREIRVQALVPEGSARRVTLYENSDPTGFRSFMRTWANVETTVRDAVVRLLGGQHGADEGPVRDLLVCTHGRRDRCCGSLGTTLSAELGARAGSASSPLDGAVHTWRTSHTGGHRFAPTVIVLPEGTAWAYADADLIDRVLQRRGDVAEVVDRYRGCAGLTNPGVQALEREALRAMGWSLLQCRRTGTDLGGGRQELTVSLPDGRVDVWTAKVDVGRTLPLPECARPLSSTSKSVKELVINEVSVVQAMGGSPTREEMLGHGRAKAP
jgi:hypothetical protein